MKPKSRTALLSRIARDELGVITLKAQDRDSLDFYELPVWCIARALTRAYEAGRRSAIALRKAVRP